MGIETNYTGVGLLLVGAFLSMSRDWLTPLLMKGYAWFSKRPVEPRAANGVKVYLTLTGTVFTVVGILLMLGVIKY